MNLLVALILVFAFILLYILIIEVFSVLFTASGLTREKARYQTISLFTNAGFTTTESELITSNKTRRKLAAICMIIGHIFSVLIVSLVVSMLSTLKGDEVQADMGPILIAFGIFVFIIILLKLPFVAMPIRKILEHIALRRISKGNGENIITELDNNGKSSIAEIYIAKLPLILKDKSIYEAKLKSQYNINVLSVKRKNKMLDASKDTMLQEGDFVAVFGDMKSIKDVFLYAETKEDKIDSIYTSSMNEIKLIDNYGEYAVANVSLNNIPDVIRNKTLAEADISRQYNIIILILTRKDIPVEVNRYTRFEAQDKIVVFGPYTNIKEVFQGTSDEK